MITLPQGFEILSNELVDKRLVMTKAEMRMVRDETRDGVYPRHYFVLCRPCSNDPTTDCKPRLYVYDASNPYDAETGRFRLASVDNEDLETALLAKVDKVVGTSEIFNTEDEVGFKHDSSEIKLDNDGAFVKAGSASIDVVNNKAFYNKEVVNAVEDADREIAVKKDIEDAIEGEGSRIDEKLNQEIADRKAADEAEAEERETADNLEKVAREAGDADLDDRKVDKVAGDAVKSIIENTSNKASLRHETNSLYKAEVAVSGEANNVELASLDSSKHGSRVDLTNDGAYYTKNEDAARELTGRAIDENEIIVKKVLDTTEASVIEKLNKEIEDRKAEDTAEAEAREAADITEAEAREAADNGERNARIAADIAEEKARNQAIVNAVNAEAAERAKEDAKKVDKVIASPRGKAMIFNEADGGGSKFEASNSIEAFVGVHDGDGEADGKYFQAYVDDKEPSGKWIGSTINGYHERFTYISKEDRATADPKDPNFEIAVIRDVIDAVSAEANVRDAADVKEAGLRETADNTEKATREANEAVVNSTLAAHKSELDTHADDIAENRDAIEEIIKKISPAASETNKLTDKDYVDNAIQQYAASYVTRDAAGNAFYSKSDLLERTAAHETYRAGEQYDPNNNDYSIVLDDETHDHECSRYIYVKIKTAEKTVERWDYQYKINNKPFTQAQLDAINSGINTEKRTAYDNHLINVENPHSVTKAQVGLGNCDNTSDMDKPVSTAQQAALNAEADIRAAADVAEIEARKDAVSAEETARKAADDAEQKARTTEDNKEIAARTKAVSDEVTRATAAEEAIQADLDSHKNNKENPHEVTKAQVGLAKVEDIAKEDLPVSNPQQEALNKKVDIEVVLDNGSKSGVYNRKGDNGACIKLEDSDGFNSAISVNDTDDANGVRAQIYAIDKTTKEGLILDVTKNNVYLHTGTFKPADQRTVDAKRLALMEDVDKKQNIIKENRDVKLLDDDHIEIKVSADVKNSLSHKDDGLFVDAERVVDFIPVASELNKGILALGTEFYLDNTGTVKSKLVVENIQSDKILHSGKTGNITTSLDTLRTDVDNNDVDIADLYDTKQRNLDLKPGCGLALDPTTDEIKITSAMVTVPATGWTPHEGVFINDIAVTGMSQYSDPISGVFIGAAEAESKDDMLEAYAMVYHLATLDGSIRLYANEKPECDFKLKIKGF